MKNTIVLGFIFLFFLSSCAEKEPLEQFEALNGKKLEMLTFSNKDIQWDKEKGVLFSKISDEGKRGSVENFEAERTIQIQKDDIQPQKAIMIFEQSNIDKPLQMLLIDNQDLKERWKDGSLKKGVFNQKGTQFFLWVENSKLYIDKRGYDSPYQSSYRIID